RTAATSSIGYALPFQLIGSPETINARNCGRSDSRTTVSFGWTRKTGVSGFTKKRSSEALDATGAVLFNLLQPSGGVQIWENMIWTAQPSRALAAVARSRPDSSGADLVEDADLPRRKKCRHPFRIARPGPGPGDDDPVVGNHVLFADVAVGNVFDGNAGSSSQLGGALTHAVTKRLGKSRMVLTERGDHPGLVHVISAMEACPTYRPWHSKQTHRTLLRPATGKCLHYYFYF